MPRLKLREILRNQKGMTMVELIVSFALLAVFMTSAVMVLSSYFKIYTNVRDYGNQQIVANTLLDTIEEELSSALSGTYQMETEEKPISYSGITIAADGTEVFYQNENNVPVVMGLKDLSGSQKAYLHVLYYPKKQEPIDWYYGKNVYNGNEISELTFAPLDGAKKANCIKVTLVLTPSTEGKGAKLNGSASYTRVVRCYNLMGEDNEVNKGQTAHSAE